MNEPDRLRIEHMIAAAKEAIAFAGDATEEDLRANRMLARAVEREVEIIGEAASKVSKELQQQHPNVPWADIVAMRNRLIHAYFEVDLRIVRSTILEDLPNLITALERVLVPGPPELK